MKTFGAWVLIGSIGLLGYEVYQGTKDLNPEIENCWAYDGVCEDGGK